MEQAHMAVAARTSSLVVVVCVVLMQISRLNWRVLLLPPDALPAVPSRLAA